MGQTPSATDCVLLDGSRGRDRHFLHVKVVRHEINMKQSPVTFQSDGLKLTGVVHTPDDLAAGERRPGFLVLHGFGSNKESPGAIVIAKQLTKWGYASMWFDFRAAPAPAGAQR